jgi:hypothetical protein
MNIIIVIDGFFISEIARRIFRGISYNVGDFLWEKLNPSYKENSCIFYCRSGLMQWRKMKEKIELFNEEGNNLFLIGKSLGARVVSFLLKLTVKNLKYHRTGVILIDPEWLSRALTKWFWDPCRLYIPKVFKVMTVYQKGSYLGSAKIRTGSHFICYVEVKEDGINHFNIAISEMLAKYVNVFFKAILNGNNPSA